MKKPRNPVEAPAPDPADPRSWEWRTSRREFLAYTGLGAAVVGVPLQLAEGAAASSAKAEVAGPAAVPIVLFVNGERHKLEVEPRETLAEVLRGKLKLTGTKIGCNRGACSACTVLVDGVPLNSCMLLAVDVGARKVVTVEGLAHGETLHPVQEAFVAHDAMQCGFCTPGMVVSVAALLVSNPEPAREDVQQAVSGNLCRCGTYPNDISAALAAAAARKGAK